MKLPIEYQFEPEIIVTVSNDDTVLFSRSDDNLESGEYNIEFFQEELPDKYYPDNVEYDPAFKLVLVYVYEYMNECIEELAKDENSEKEHDDLCTLFWEGDAKDVLEWRFGSLENGLQYVESMRQLLKSFATKEHINFMDKKKLEKDIFVERNSEIDKIASTYRLIMLGNEEHFVGEDDWAKVSEDTSYVTRIPFKGL